MPWGSSTRLLRVKARLSLPSRHRDLDRSNVASKPRRLSLARSPEAHLAQLHRSKSLMMALHRQDNPTAVPNPPRIPLIA